MTFDTLFSLLEIALRNRSPGKIATKFIAAALDAGMELTDGQRQQINERALTRNKELSANAGGKQANAGEPKTDPEFRFYHRNQTPGLRCYGCGCELDRKPTFMHKTVGDYCVACGLLQFGARRCNRLPYYQSYRRKQERMARMGQIHANQTDSEFPAVNETETNKPPLHGMN